MTKFKFPKTVTLDVRGRHIIEGCPKSSLRCAVALCARETFKIPQDDHLAVNVDDMIVVEINGVEARYALPPVAHAFIRAFDGGDALLGPISFEAMLLSEQDC